MNATARQVTVDLGTTPVRSGRVTVTALGAQIGQRVVIVADATALGDELEMDGLSCSGRVSATDTVEIFVAAVPGPVRGVRHFLLQVL